MNVKVTKLRRLPSGFRHFGSSFFLSSCPAQVSSKHQASSDNSAYARFKHL